MKLVMPLLIFVVTLALLAVGMFQSGSPAGTLGIAAGSPLPGFPAAAQTPEQALNNLLSRVRGRQWSAAYTQLANADEIEEELVAREWQGGYGSLRSFSGLESWDLQPLRQAGHEAQVRVVLHWATAVGPQDEVRDLTVVRRGDAWQVVWPPSHFPDVPAQVIPVNYLRWDLVSSAGDGEWGQRNVDAPRVRILSMNAMPYAGGTIVMGEIVNEDTIPAFVNVNATLLDSSGDPIEEESSFDKILHVLLPKQVSPYRIDFPNVSLEKVKSVRMSNKATLVPAAADPVVGVMDQKLETDALGRTVLEGKLLNQGGVLVNIPHVIATFYDDTGKVIWVADEYVDRPLFPRTPQPFSVSIPAAAAQQVHSHHVVVNQYILGAS